MPRLLFEKTGNAIWISHLDLMRFFHRAFKRAGLPLKHTQGFNPRPSVSIALPLSVGIESSCELMDFVLDGESVSDEELCRRLNDASVDGIRVKKVYNNGGKLKNLALLDCSLQLIYDHGVPEEAPDAIQGLFTRDKLIVEKRSKNGPVQQNIIPMIQYCTLIKADEHTVELLARICCQNPSLNPTQLAAAISAYLPQFTPDDIRYRRVEVFDINGNVFR